jgi:hypothetical protein
MPFGRLRAHVRRRFVAWLALGFSGTSLVAYVVMIRMPGKSYARPFTPLDDRERSLEAELRADVRVIAGDVGERNLSRFAGLADAASHIESSLRAAGLAPRRLPFDALGRAVDNIEAEVTGASQAAEIVVVGAHYDSVEGTRGANDNGSGVAALLAAARAFARRTERPARTLRFVAFANEEAPYFQSDAMGSLVYARACRARGDRVVAMMSLETVGFYTDAPDTQHYPPPLGLVYPSTGNFIGFVGNVGSRSLVHRAIGAFRESTPFPSEGAALPEWIPGVGWSDQWAFWQAGYPAIMVTDTAPFRYPHYHRASDRLDKLSYDRMARVVGGIINVIDRLANP